MTGGAAVMAPVGRSTPRRGEGTAAKPVEIPQVHLYGELPSDPELDFLHVESINVRSSINNWTIAPHSHPDHAQFLLVTRGGGILRIEDRALAIVPPALIFIPTSLVHAIDFEPGTDGTVITASLGYLRGLVRDDLVLTAALERTLCRHLGDSDTATALPNELQSAFLSLADEFVWSAPGRRSAIAAHMLRILVGLVRAGGQSDTDEDTITSARSLQLLQRYRALIEANFRKGLPIGYYAKMLRVSQTSLNAACRHHCGRSAMSLVHDRLMIEAKRSLLYTQLSVSDIAQALGFQEPAYFCRFFSKRAGRAPSLFRARGATSGQE